MSLRILTLALVVGCLWADPAKANPCVSAQEMAALANDFNQFRDLASRGQYCYDGSDEAGLIASLMFLKHTQFDASMARSPDELFSGRFARDWYGYFKQRIRRVVIEDNCQRGVAAFVYMGNPVMFVCPYLMTGRFSALDRASVMMHEARHIDGFGHITCSRGPRAGIRGACDPRISEGGSYAVTVETYAQAARYAPGLHPAVRAFARAAAVTYADETFENPARVDREQQLTLLSANGDFYAGRPTANGDLQLVQEGQVPLMGRINVRANQMILFPVDRSEPARAVFTQNQGELDAVPDEMTADYNQLDPGSRSEWVDVHSGTQWSAILRTRSLEFKCNPTSNQTQTVSVQADAPQSTIYPNGYSRAATLAHFVGQSGRIYEFGCDQRQRAFVRASSLAFDQRFYRIYRVGPWTYGLRVDGTVFVLQGRNTRALNLGAVGVVSEIAPTATFRFFDDPS